MLGHWFWELTGVDSRLENSQSMVPCFLHAWVPREPGSGCNLKSEARGKYFAMEEVMMAERTGELEVWWYQFDDEAFACIGSRRGGKVIMQL